MTTIEYLLIEPRETKPSTITDLNAFKNPNNLLEPFPKLCSPRHKYLKCHDSLLYSCASLDTNISVTGDEDGFVNMWDNRLGDTSVITRL